MSLHSTAKIVHRVHPTPLPTPCNDLSHAGPSFSQNGRSSSQSHPKSYCLHPFRFCLGTSHSGLPSSNFPTPHHLPTEDHITAGTQIPLQVSIPLRQRCSLLYVTLFRLWPTNIIISFGPPYKSPHRRLRSLLHRGCYGIILHQNCTTVVSHPPHAHTHTPLSCIPIM